MILDLTRRTLWTFLIMRISFASDCMDFSYFSDSSVRTRLTDMGILICGSGQGMAMRANKWNHVRAALCWTQKSPSFREHNDANILCLGSRVTDHDLCLEILQKFLTTDFENGRHLQRVVKINSTTA